MDEENDWEGPDPTKEAFFSDMGDMEQEISEEAYELVEHALSLIDSEYYDDAIEVLRQSMGLYSQINKDEEIKSGKKDSSVIRNKISLNNSHKNIPKTRKYRTFLFLSIYYTRKEF